MTNTWNNFCGWQSQSSNSSVKTCWQCRTEINSQARVCPHCRSKQAVNIGKGPVILIGGILLVMVVLGALSSNDRKSSSTSVAPAVGAQITDRYLEYVKTDRKGVQNCKNAVADMAKYDIKWTSWGTNFNYHNRYARADGYVLLVGDNAEAQNGFGGWVRVNYECLYDPNAQRVVRTTMNKGRLPSNIAD